MTHLEKDFVACIAAFPREFVGKVGTRAKKRNEGERGRERYNSTGNACYAG